MHNPKQHTIHTKNGIYHYINFDSSTAMDEFILHQQNILSASNQNRLQYLNTRTKERIVAQSNWFGTPVPSSIIQLQNHKKFLGMHLVDTIRPKIEKALESYLKLLQFTPLPKPKMAYNDRSLGVFSFDRAAMGLYKTYPINLSSAIDSAISQLHIASGLKSPRTAVKKVYAYFENVPMDKPLMELYILAGAPAKIKGDNILYVGIACSILVEYLQERGVAVKVNILYGSEDRKRVYFADMILKKADQPLDLNQLLLLSSDPRYFRFKGFEKLISIYDYFKATIPEHFGIMSQHMATDFVAQYNPKAIVFEQSFSVEDAVKQVYKIIKHHNQIVKNK